MLLRPYTTLIMLKNVQHCWEECEDFDFLLQGSFNSLEDLVLSSAHYSKNQPSSWNSFFDAMFPTRN